jgi:hypothetical protein
MVTISSNITNPLFQALFNVSSVSGAAGREDVKSGRGGLGKGEVLCVLLTKGGESGGAETTFRRRSGRRSRSSRPAARRRSHRR